MCWLRDAMGADDGDDTDGCVEMTPEEFGAFVEACSSATSGGGADFSGAGRRPPCASVAAR